MTGVVLAFFSSHLYLFAFPTSSAHARACVFIFSLVSPPAFYSIISLVTL